MVGVALVQAPALNPAAVLPNPTRYFVARSH
jgi:hypothetical protein